MEPTKFMGAVAMTLEMEKQMQMSVPYIVHESAQARAERHIRRLVIALIIAIIVIFATNVAWIWYISQYDFTTEEITLGTDGSGNTNYIGQDGEINNGVHPSGEENEN